MLSLHRVREGNEVVPARPVPVGAARTETADGRRALLAYEPALDGVRGLGLLFVMATHAGFAWAKGGFLWVSTFFTLSGYLIATLLLIEHERHGAISLRAFWSRRFRRLMPAALVALGGVAAFGATIAEGAQLQRLRGDALAAMGYVANWRFIVNETEYADLFVEPSPVQHFWTLSIEEQFYVFLPLALLGGLRAARGRVAPLLVMLVGACAASILWMRHLLDSGVPIDRLYFGTDTRLVELLAGVLLAVVLSRWKPGATKIGHRAIAGAGAVALGVMLLWTFTVFRTDRWLYEGGLALYAGLSMVAIAAGLQPDSLVRRVLSVHPLPWIGRLSYGAYLFHWPLFLWIDEARTGLTSWPLFAVRVAVTFGLAWLSLTYIERPIRDGRAIVGPRVRAIVPSAVAAVVLLLVAVTMEPPPGAVTLTGADQAMPEVVARPLVTATPATAGVVRFGSSPTTADAAPTTAPSTALPSASDTSTSGAHDDSAPLPIETTTEVTEPVRMLVVGDSQAWVLGNALVRWAEHSDLAVVWNQAVRGCGIVRGGEAKRLGEITQGACEDWEPYLAEAVTAFQPDVVVALSGSWDFIDRRLPEWPDFLSYGDPVFDAHLVEEYRTATQSLGAGGASVVWLTTPCYELEGFGDDPRHLNDVLLPRVVESTPDVKVVDLFARVCPGGRFTQELGGLSNVRPDGLHLSDVAADWVAAWLGPQLRTPS